MWSLIKHQAEHSYRSSTLTFFIALASEENTNGNRNYAITPDAQMHLPLLPELIFEHNANDPETFKRKLAGGI